MNLEQLCVGCMEDAESKPTCPFCGHVEKTVTDLTYITPRTILKGRYMIGRVLGRGGFGITYISWDKLEGSKMAIKEYFPEGTVARIAGQAGVSIYSGEKGEFFRQGLEKFLGEAQAVKRYKDHPGIVNVIDYFDDNGTGYIVMEYLDGETLTSYLARNGGKISWITAVTLLANIFSALDTMHKDDMLHRDIKPDNIYIRKDGVQAVLIDFGVARQFIGLRSRNLSSVFTPGYTPFEQYCEDGRQGPWTDVYALGATLYRMLTGERPPEATDRVVQDRLEPLTVKGVNVPPQVEATILKALAVNSKDRFQTVDEFRIALTEEMDSATVIGKVAISEYMLPEVNKVKCPQCKAINTLSVGQNINNTLCRECGQLLAASPAKGNHKKFRYIAAAAVVVLALAGGIYWLSPANTTPEKTNAHSDIQKNTGAKTGAVPGNSGSAGMPEQNAAAAGAQFQAASAVSQAGTTGEAVPANTLATERNMEPAKQQVQSTPSVQKPAAVANENWETDARGIKLADSSAQAGEVFMWSGANADGYADGAGTISYFRGGVLQRKMTGTWRQGRLIPGTAVVANR